jgi:hypothetical protein
MLYVMQSKQAGRASCNKSCFFVNIAFFFSFSFLILFKLVSFSAEGNGHISLLQSGFAENSRSCTCCDVLLGNASNNLWVLDLLSRFIG